MKELVFNYGVHSHPIYVSLKFDDQNSYYLIDFEIGSILSEIIKPPIIITRGRQNRLSFNHPTTINNLGLLCEIALFLELYQNMFEGDLIVKSI